MAHSSVFEPPPEDDPTGVSSPDDDPTGESPPEDDPPDMPSNGQGEESDAVQSVARVKGMMAKKMAALRKYIVRGE